MAAKATKKGFQWFVETALDALVVVNDQGEIVVVNEHTERLFGYDRSELIGRDVEILLPPGDRQLHQDTRQRFLGSPVVRRMGEGVDDLNGFTREGKPFPVEISLNPVLVEDARLVVAAIHDVTESKRTEEKLKRSQKLLTAASERLSAALNALPANIALLNREGEITLVNRGWEAFAEANGCSDPGYSLRRNYLEVCARAVEDRFPDAERVHDGLKAILGGRARNFSYEYAAHSAEEQRWYQMTAAALPGRLGAVVMHADVTQRLETEQQLSRAQKMEAIGQLTGGIAHDFNNLLMVIDGYARRSLGKLDDIGTAQSCLEEVLKATEKATDLTRQLLVFSRRQIMEKKLFRVDEAIDDITNLLRRSVSDRYELRLELTAGDVCVNTDPGELGQALLNLTVNARDAMPKGGTIVIGSRVTEFDDTLVASYDGATAGRYVEIFVKDQGCGMDRSTRERIFEPFFTTKEQGKGTGLGLAMIYGFCRQSGGIVDVLSTPGEGATFMMFLPAVEGKPLARSTVVVEEDYRGNGERILVVEDDEALLDLTAGILVDHGYEVLRAGNGMEALEVDQDCDQSIDLLLSDVMMPGLGGFEVADLIREKRPDMHVIFMSGYPKNNKTSDPGVPSHGQFLQKPVKPAHLLQAVRQELDEAAPNIVA